jgi:protein-S-isoprenylcysteine O-methyltransferase Ste14
MVVMVAGAALDATGGPNAVEALESSGIRGAATVIAAIGIAGLVGAQAAMGREWRIGVSADQGTRLITGGPFAYVRNPIYTAMFVGFGGIVMTDPTPVALAGYAMLVIGIQIQVRAVEEPYLRSAHADGFAEYASRVGRFVPGVGRLDQT